MKLNEKKTELTIAGIGSALVIITTIVANLSEIDRNKKEKETTPTETTIVIGEESQEENEKIVETVIVKEVETIFIKETPETSTTEFVTEAPTEPKPKEKKTRLTSLDYFNASDDNGGFFIKGSEKDNLGNAHTDVLIPHYWLNCWTQYYINRKYNSFSGTVFLTYDAKTETGSHIFEVYGDDTLLYSYEFTAGVLPQEFTVDVTDVEILELRRISSGTRYYCFGISDAILTSYE